MTEDPAAGSAWASECGSGCGCLGDSGAAPSAEEEERLSVGPRHRFDDRPETARQGLDRRSASAEITKDSYQASGAVAE